MTRTRTSGAASRTARARVDAGAVRQVDVHEDEVRGEHDDGRERARDVVCLADDLEVVGAAQRGDDPVAEQRVVVDEDRAAGATAATSASAMTANITHAMSK